jgi:hypothetical protein
MTRKRPSRCVGFARWRNKESKALAAASALQNASAGLERLTLATFWSAALVRRFHPQRLLPALVDLILNRRRQSLRIISAEREFSSAA